MNRPRNYHRPWISLILLLVAVGLIAHTRQWMPSPTSYAQQQSDLLYLQQNNTISFANPSALQVTIGEGHDFATLQLGDSWDMDNPRDMGYEIGFTNIHATGGIWHGTYSGMDQSAGTPTAGYLFPLFQGFSTPVAGGLSQELSFTKVGAEDRYAIDASKYTRLSYRLAVSQRPVNGPFFVQWTTASPVTWPIGENRFGRLDACQGTTRFVAWQGWHTYNFDLSQPQGDSGIRAGAWQGLVRGLRLDPAATAPAGTEIKIDWIRLSDPNSAPVIAIPWNIANAGPNDRIDIYIADNPSGTDASPLAFGLPAAAGRYDLATSMLPPGQHYFQLHLKDGAVENGCTVAKGTSGWIGPLTITPAPIVTFAKPSMTSGPDYATSVLGQPWDMTSSSQIVTPGSPYPQTLAEQSFTNGIFRARAALIPPHVESDSQFWLRVDPQRPIDTTRFRYFTVRLKVDMPPGRDINWAIAYGWGGRVIWWNENLQTDGSESKYGTYYEGWRNYSVDLARAFPPPAVSNPLQARNILTPREQNAFPAQLGWTQLGTVKHLRYDPLETMAQAVGTGADIFEVDWVKLTANDEVRRGQPFEIMVKLNLPLAQLSSLTHYYTTDPSQPTQQRAVMQSNTVNVEPIQPGNYRIYLPLILRMGTSGDDNDSLRFVWDTATVQPGTYYICSVAATANSSTTWCSETPVVVQP
ncbi:MAG: hypothetical protein EI684_10435 [Candidatus Viridilinea halotolerans]|uniref:Uncharacterized protein n=1 Tax=Candidatus Viridilinea halotolerans TaxID=2491704 RepID=A0A426U046_9CHLR|nr:MAG: hypothetical protein EI684_10435 [Candidatus Viridilinea halotolerans]